MPPLHKPKTAAYVTLPARSAMVAAETDVLVVGGGPAGIGAALGAVRNGAKVILTERYGFLGGNATAALVMPLMSFYNQHAITRTLVSSETLFPADHGPGDPVIAGVVEEVLTRLIKNGGAIFPSHKTGYVVPFDPEIFKLTVMNILDEAGVQLLFHAFAADVLKENDEVKGVVFETKSGPIVIKAKVVVDCTGDGDIAARAGVPFDIGRPEDGLMQPMTLMFRVAEFDSNLFSDYVRRHPDQWKGVHGLWELVKQATEKGILKLTREDILLFATPRAKEIAVNSTRVTHVNGISVWDLSHAEYVARHQMQHIIQFLNEYVPGFKDSYIIQSGVQVGVRETRRIQGQYSLTGEDVLAARKFPDVIARSSYPIDIHNPKGKGTTLKRLPVGESYDIPLRCLIPKGTEKLLVAGRCISGTSIAMSSYRVMPVCMATGQAAGACAALASKKNAYIKDISYREVQITLIKQNADLGKDLHFIIKNTGGVP